MYSEIIETTRYQYRYNYDTGELEQLERYIAKRQVSGRMSPVVDWRVIKTQPIARALFDKTPGYWAELFESVQQEKPP